MLFSRYFWTKIFLKRSYNWNQYPQTCKKASHGTLKVSVLELRMPYLCNFGLKV